MILVIAGRTGSGKSTVVARLQAIGFQPIIEYTTRPARNGEIDGKNYYFVSDKVFDEMASEFAESKAFHTIYGTWKYGAKKSDFSGDGNKVCAMGPVQAMDVIRSGIPVISVYLDAPLSVVLDRATSERGDDAKEVKRRIETDEPYYREFEKIATIRVNAAQPVDEVFDELRVKLLEIAISRSDHAAERLLRMVKM